jgi:hypothetical protein
VGLDYRRARSAAIAGAEDNMDAFVGRLVDRLGVLSGDTSALVSLVASVANSFLVPPPERMNDKVAVLREGIARSPHIDGVYVGYPSGAFFHVVDLDSAAWRMALDAPRGAAIAVRSMERNDQGKPFDRILFLDASGLQFAERHAASNGFDPRTRPWYRAAVNGKAPVAIGPYEMATTGNLGMTISQAHRGNPQIVIGADVVLDTITDFSVPRAADRRLGFLRARCGGTTDHPLRLHHDAAHHGIEGPGPAGGHAAGGWTDREHPAQPATGRKGNSRRSRKPHLSRHGGAARIGIASVRAPGGRRRPSRRAAGGRKRDARSGTCRLGRRGGGRRSPGPSCLRI